jgi:hypothetical protein
MDTMIAYCGLACDTCPVHLATLENDFSKQAEMRIRIAEELSKIYGTIPKPEIITDCDGCRTSNGRLFTGCAGCGIRICAGERNHINCAWCSDYPCGKLEKHFVFDPESRKRLEEIRASLWHNNCS